MNSPLCIMQIKKDVCMLGSFLIYLVTQKGDDQTVPEHGFSHSPDRLLMFLPSFFVLLHPIKSNAQNKPNEDITCSMKCSFTPIAKIFYPTFETSLGHIQLSHFNASYVIILY